MQNLGTLRYDNSISASRLILFAAFFVLLLILPFAALADVTEQFGTPDFTSPYSAGQPFAVGPIFEIKNAVEITAIGFEIQVNQLCDIHYCVYSKPNDGVLSGNYAKEVCKTSTNVPPESPIAEKWYTSPTFSLTLDPSKYYFFAHAGFYAGGGLQFQFRFQLTGGPLPIPSTKGWGDYINFGYDTTWGGVGAATATVAPQGTNINIPIRVTGPTLPVTLFEFSVE